MDVMTPIRNAYSGFMVGNMGYSADEAEAEIVARRLDAVAFGVPFIGNPDLPTRFAKNAQLTIADPQKFYSAGSEGYSDYPFLRA